MSYREHRLSALIVVDPERAATELTRAYRKAGCNRAAACRALAQDGVAVSEGTWDRWVGRLGIRASLDGMRQLAIEEGRVDRGDVGWPRGRSRKGIGVKPGKRRPRAA